MSYGNDEEGIGQNYRMLKLLVYHMARATDVDGTLIDGSNVLHAACRIRHGDFSRVHKLINYLVSPDASRLEAKTRPSSQEEKREVLLQYEPDARGNLPLHTFVGNASYLSDSRPAVYEIVQCLTNSAENELEPAAMSNDEGLLPLKIAMMSGRVRVSIAALTMKYPHAAITDGKIDSKIFVHLLGTVTRLKDFNHIWDDMPSLSDRIDAQKRVHRTCLNTVFELIHARPDVFSNVGADGSAASASRSTSDQAGVRKMTKMFRGIFSRDAGNL